MAPKESRKKALNALNQDALDRLYDKCEQASTAHSSKYVFTVRKAAKSVQSCPTPILTFKEAKALHGVGDSLARIIVPKQDDVNTSSLLRIPSITSTASATKLNNDSSTTEGATLPRKKVTKLLLPEGKSNAPRPSEKLTAYHNELKKSESLILPSDDWRVILIVDGRERGWEKVLADLQMSGIPSEKRNMPIGDMAWIARSGKVEVMLGTIIERKEVNDLASSLFGTRYKEQRLRLQHCGLPQVFFLVEGDTKDVSNCSHECLHMAMMETRVQLGFQIVQTRHLEDTVRFLKNVHRRILQRSFPSAFADNATASSLPTFSLAEINRRGRRRSIKKRHKRHRLSFEEMVFDKAPIPPLGAARFVTYTELKCKVENDREEGTKTIGGVFCRMLKQITKVSNSTIPSLVHAYPTPNTLFRTLQGIDASEAKALLADLETGAQKVGEQRASEIYHALMAIGDEGGVVVSSTDVAVSANCLSQGTDPTNISGRSNLLSGSPLQWSVEEEDQYSKTVSNNTGKFGLPNDRQNKTGTEKVLMHSMKLKTCRTTSESKTSEDDVFIVRSTGTSNGSHNSRALSDTTSSDSEEEEPLEVRIRRLRERSTTLARVDFVAQTKSKRPRLVIPPARHVSASDSEQPEVIELSD